MKTMVFPFFWGSAAPFSHKSKQLQLRWEVREELERILGSADYFERLKTEQRYVEELWWGNEKENR